MQSTEIRRRQQFTQQQRINLLDELSIGNLTITQFAESKGIHPVTIHQWKRKMSSIQKHSQPNEDLNDSQLEVQRLSSEVENLKKALADMAIENQIQKAHNQVLKKKYKDQQSAKQKK
jgi:transposase-like protein